MAAYHIPGAPPPSAPPLWIAPIRAVMTRTLPRRDFLKASRILRPDVRIQLNELIRTWISLGYDSTHMVVAPGQFARRGGILDLWPPTESAPVRLEFFGDEIETLRRFDPATQRTLTAAANLERLLVTPAREYLLPPSLPPGIPPEVNEFYLPQLHPQAASALEYLPRQALILLDDEAALRDTASEIEEQAVNQRAEAVREGVLAADFPVPYLSWGELEDALTSRAVSGAGGGAAGGAVIELGSAETWDETPTEDAAAIRQLAELFSAGPRFAGRLKHWLDFMAERYQQAEAVTVVSRQAARLGELWGEVAPVLASEPSDRPRPEPTFIEGSLTEGWAFAPPAGTFPPQHLLTDGEIFGWRRPEARRRARRAAETPESAYIDLRPGDWVVHVDHGIGRFSGLVTRTVEGMAREYLCVEYADEAQLFVPVHQVDRLTRYVGPDGREPQPSRLGSHEWRSVKQFVRAAVQEVATDLLELYAKRRTVEGFAFGPDTVWQQELEASFPYVETEDQMRVIGEVKADMENLRPMDRLICGDVGYGKTEVALRAAFKAVNDGKQVAVLVPTTVLAQQHYNTFRQRLAAFPVEVEMLSRFRSPQQQRDIIQRLNGGGIDILIGTHRLLSSDVQFKDLGLLIIDEEQRFGVTHKEKLKRLRTEIDVLTLTATPIPRTLYMAISGARDISTINTPPEERLPIVTHVGPYSPRLVRQAILREMERGGQVFFVHNRVHTINAMHRHLEKLVPEARIVVAHGQMPENELAERMEAFAAGEVDILLSTSIIESGLDIPSANTLIIDRADTFGLAQLYQLRGRVGRGAQRAYAYFFRHAQQSPTEEGRQRLETLAENTQLGAGLSIAMRDLEIRGAGDILGARQHGHIAAVGFHLYTRLLADAVRKLRGQQGLPPSATLLELKTRLPTANVELPLPVSIPAEYVPDKQIRLGLYRRIADLQTRSEIEALQAEFQDRFGPPPEPVLNLLLQLQMKILAERAGVVSIAAESGQIVLRYPDNELPDPLPELDPPARLGKTAIWLPYSPDEDWPAALTHLLETLAAAQGAAALGEMESRP
jgi:transcription-repair coupling factor (superfamily II helicase)